MKHERNGMSKIFFSMEQAKEFAQSLMEQGFEKVEIWLGTDGFKQSIYTVRWH